MGGTEILVILIVALLFLGPDKLPEAAKSISKGIRDLRKQTREFQDTIEADERIGGAIRDIKSALNGEDPRPRPRPPRPQAASAAAIEAASAAANATAVGAVAAEAGEAQAGEVRTGEAQAGEAQAGNAAEPLGEVGEASAAAGPRVTLPSTAGERHAPHDAHDAHDEAAELAAMIKPADGAIAKGSTNDSGSPGDHG
ncbi:MAG TPA: twin-arginine translocase TatA/TatE family subunit [Kofleriaceae bacterium]|nr:twin-arginine translocase TatA/TatE family subunit [Kofleriaceae bacterium]